MALVSPWLAGATAATAVDLVAPGGAWRYLKGTQEASSPANSWRQAGFDDSAWAQGDAPFGYGVTGAATTLSDMRFNYTSLFLRRQFQVPDASAVASLTLTVRFDDGYIAWINGREVRRQNAPASSSGSVASAAVDPPRSDNVTIANPGEYLVAGTNVIAVQGFNHRLIDVDFFLDASLAGEAGSPPAPGGEGDGEPEEDPTQVRDTAFSVNRGFYSDTVDVEITSATPGAAVRYTVDGSWPSASRGTVYSGPVPISRTTVLRALAYMPDGSLEPTNVDTQTYILFDKPVDRFGAVQSAVPSAVRTALLSLPTLSIAMDNAQFEEVEQNGSGAIGKTGDNAEWERPCSIELFYPDDMPVTGGGRTTGDFQVDCGLRPHSWTGTPKRAFKLVFKKEYGPGKLDEPLFASAPHHGESAANEIDKVVLRANSNDGWVSRWKGSREALYVRDQFTRDLQLDMGSLGARGTFVHLYVNGQYWGVYNPVERPDDEFMASYLGGAEEDYFAFNHGGAIDGDATHYNAMHQRARTRDFSVPAEYESFKQYLDVSQFADYLLSNFYCTNHDKDWPVNNGRAQNFYGGNRNVPQGPVQYFGWDHEFSLTREAHVHVNFRPAGPPNAKDVDAVFIPVWFNLMRNPDFRMLFADRAYRHLFNDGAMTAAASEARLRNLTDFVQEAVTVAERWRWEGTSDLVVIGDYEAMKQQALRFIRDNVTALVSDMRSLGYYPSVDPPRFSYNSATVEVTRLGVSRGSQIGLSAAGGGTLYHALGGADPRSPGGGVSGDARTGAQVRIESPTVIRARVLQNSEWSPVAELEVFVEQSFAGLRLTEIMYNPPVFVANGEEVDGDLVEFLELKNVGQSPIDLSGVTFSDGIDYAFAVGTVLDPGELTVLVSHEAAFRQKYPGVSFSGSYGKNLSNSGETLSLSDYAGQTILTVTYDDAAPWPASADDGGHSLVPASTTPPSNQDDSSQWRASAAPGGSPGADDEGNGGGGGETALFIRGDANGDTIIDIGDGFHVLVFLFRDASIGTCRDAMDTDDNGTIEIVDALVLLNFMFAGGPAPRAPHPQEGTDPTRDSLDCARSS